MGTYLLITDGHFSKKVLLVRAESLTEARYLADIKLGKVNEWRQIDLDDLGALAVHVGLDDSDGLKSLLP